ncbi:hypothetical protein TWF569_000310 [Orbilia oligospora]|nr:hypothetical protein TWF569_000310 [Orbilia oligospora]
MEKIKTKIFNSNEPELSVETHLKLVYLGHAENQIQVSLVSYSRMWDIYNRSRRYHSEQIILLFNRKYCKIGPGLVGQVELLPWWPRDQLVHK